MWTLRVLYVFFYVSRVCKTWRTYGDWELQRRSRVVFFTAKRKEEDELQICASTEFLTQMKVTGQISFSFPYP